MHKNVLAALFASGLLAGAPLAQATNLVFCSEGSPAGFDPAQYTTGTDFDASAETIFNKLTPLEPGSLKDRVEALAARLKFPLGELQVIDGSKRSAHSNAYFTGLPWKKKIVLYDTLIEKSSEKEVEAILAHELGHWHMGHTTKLLGIASFHLFYVFALFSVFINNRSLYEAFGFYNEKPIMIGFILFNDVLSPTDSVVKLLMNILTRRFEYEAGMYFPMILTCRVLSLTFSQMPSPTSSATLPNSLLPSSSSRSRTFLPWMPTGCTLPTTTATQS